MGAYHTLDLELNRKFTVRKAEWDSIALERVEMACDVTQNADVAAIIMQEGIAHICLITASMTMVRSKIDVAIPRKRKGNPAQHEKVKSSSCAIQKSVAHNSIISGARQILRIRHAGNTAPHKLRCR